MDVYLIVGGERIFFKERPDQNLHPRHHAEICRESLERRGYEVSGPFNDVRRNLTRPLLLLSSMALFETVLLTWRVVVRWG